MLQPWHMKADAGRGSWLVVLLVTGYSSGPSCIIFETYPWKTCSSFVLTFSIDLKPWSNSSLNTVCKVIECFDNDVCSLTTTVNLLTVKRVQFGVHYMKCLLFTSRRPSGRQQSHHEISWLGPRARSFTSFAVEREHGSRIKGRIRPYRILYLALTENRREARRNVYSCS